MILAVWADGFRDNALAKVREEVADRTTGIAWRREGQYEIGQGTHEVNASKHKAWIVLRESPEKKAYAGYMTWEGTQFLEEVKRTVDLALSSLTYDRPVAEYLKLATDRPAKIAAHRRSVFQKMLEDHGLASLHVGGPIVERDGGFYQIFKDDFHGETFHGLHPLGDLPSAKYFHVNYSSPPKGVSNWPQVCRFSSEEGAWKADCEITLTPTMTSRLNQRHADPSRSYFYAVVFDLPADPVENYVVIENTFRYPDYWKALEPMKARFAKGEMVEAAK